MGEVSGERVGGDRGVDDLSGEGDGVSSLGDAQAEFVVVGEGLDERGESADGFEGGTRDGERGAETEADLSVELEGGEDAGEEVGGDAEGLEFGSESGAIPRPRIGTGAPGVVAPWARPR